MAPPAPHHFRTRARNKDMAKENALRLEKLEKAQQEMQERMMEMMKNMMKGKNSAENTNPPNVAIP